MGGSPPFSLCHSASLLTVTPHKNTISFSLVCPIKSRLCFVPDASSTDSHFTFRVKNSSFLTYLQQSQRTHLSFSAVYGHGRSGLCVHALKKRRKGSAGLMETDDFDGNGDEEDDVDGDEEGDGYGDEEDDDDEGVVLPFEKMKRWLERKPSGFGEGKVYDTSVEDKLLEEMEQSREVQIANLNKLKDNPVDTSSKENDQKKKVPEVVQSAIHVRVVNLPKKKNIHRDLKSAFKGVPGIIKISPAVSGNKKTKDPICKGFAFVDFKSEEDAARFVQIFSRQTIAFGKIEKLIKCEMINPESPNSAHEHYSVDTHTAPELPVPGLEEDPDTDFGIDNFSSDLWETPSDGSDPDDELNSAKLEDIKKNRESINVSELNGGDNTEQKTKLASGSKSSKPRKKIQAIEKKLISKGKVAKVPKLDIPGSARRLKIKEKAVLTDVFSKYGVKTAPTSKEESQSVTS